MKLNSSIKNKTIATIILVVMGLGFLVAAIFLHINDYNIKNNWIEETATIIEINHFKENIKISYSYNGVQYTDVPSFYSSELSIGDILMISINPNNPHETYLHNMNLIFILFYVFGGIFLVVSVVILFLSYREKKNKKHCLENGKKRVIDVVELRKTNYYYNKKTYYCIIVSNNGMEYKSELFLLPKDFSFINDAVVDIYFCEDGKYYIDITTYREKIDILDEEW